jgi:hypothetical protein
MKKFLLIAVLFIGAGAVNTAEVQAGPVCNVLKKVVTAPIRVVRKVQPLRRVARAVGKVVRGGARVVAGGGACAGGACR